MLPEWWDTATKRSQGQDRARTTGRSVKKSDRSAVETQAIRGPEQSERRQLPLNFSASLWNHTEYHLPKLKSLLHCNYYTLISLILLYFTLWFLLAFSDCSTNLNSKKGKITQKEKLIICLVPYNKQGLIRKQEERCQLRDSSGNSQWVTCFNQIQISLHCTVQRVKEETRQETQLLSQVSCNKQYKEDKEEKTH